MLLLLKGVARKLSDHCEAKGLLPEEQCGFRPDRSPTDMDIGSNVCDAQAAGKGGRQIDVSLFMCFTNLQKAYDPADRTLL